MTALREKFYRNLYRSYHQGAGVGHFITERVSSSGWFLIGLFGVSVVMSGNLGQSVVILLSALLAGVLAIAFFWAVLRRGQVSTKRILPPTASVGDDLTYRVRVTNQGKRTLHDIALKESSDDPRPGIWEFLNLTEPGEEKRNLFDRIFVFYRWKWLSEGGGRWETQEMSEGFSLKPGESSEMTLRLLPLRRGVIELWDLRVLLPDPFGLFQRSRPSVSPSQEVLVLPRRYSLPAIELGGQSELKVGGETASTQRGEGGEFLGLREYRPGDPMRKIHWKSWARTGIPVVKQHEQNRFARYGLILDTKLDGSSPEIFEECVSVAASFVSTMDKSRCLLDLMFVRDQPQVYTAGRGVAKASELMEVLARVEASDVSGYEALTVLISKYAAEMSAAVVVLSGWDEERDTFIKKLRASGLELKVFAVLGAGLSAGAGIHSLHLGEIEKDLLASVS